VSVTHWISGSLDIHWTSRHSSSTFSESHSLSIFSEYRYSLEQAALTKYRAHSIFTQMNIDIHWVDNEYRYSLNIKESWARYSLNVDSVFPEHRDTRAQFLLSDTHWSEYRDRVTFPEVNIETECHLLNIELEILFESELSRSIFSFLDSCLDIQLPPDWTSRLN